ncbi:MAG: dihydroorotase family protein [Nitrososphaerota archaeon]|nr:dihydroorotase family protein [Nitrososphaerota archaeon]
MIVDSVILNAKAYLKGQITDCCIAIEEGIIHKIGKETQMPNADQKINLHSRLLVLPGLIDTHVHLRDEGKAYKEDFTSGTSAAAAGGFTTVLDMPNNTPITMSAQTLRNRIETAQRRIVVNTGFYSEFPQTLPEIKEIANQGAVGFKLFMGDQIGGVNIDDNTAITEALKATTEVKLPVAIHAEDHTLLATNEAKLKQAKKTAPADYLRAHTKEVERVAVERIIKLSAKTEAQLHFCHISTKEGVATITEAKKTQKNITCEVTPNHLMLSNEEVERYGALAIMAPPLRDRLEVEALWQSVNEGLVDTFGSDHAPHTLEEKQANNIWEVKAGIPGLEVTLPLMLTMVKKGKLCLEQVVSHLAENPAQIYGLTDRGYLKAGQAADLTIVDYQNPFKIDASKFKSKAKFSPYNGWEVNGKPVKTIVGGQIVYEENEVVAKGGTGKIVRGGAR